MKVTQNCHPKFLASYITESILLYNFHIIILFLKFIKCFPVKFINVALRFTISQI